PCAAGPSSSAATTFEKLSTLVGQWEGKTTSGRSQHVSYRLTAAGSALVETWTLGPDRESLTLYHLDGDRLLADHYCPQGNQPRLQLTSSAEPGAFAFEFREGANLDVKGKAHQQAFWIKIDNSGSFTRSETYVENGSAAAEIAAATPDAAITYTRAGLAKPAQ